MANVSKFNLECEKAGVNFSAPCLEERPLKKGRSWSYYYGDPSEEDKKVIRNLGNKYGLKDIRFLGSKREGGLNRIMFTLVGKAVPEE